jgi:hypothetical protein
LITAVRNQRQNGDRIDLAGFARIRGEINHRRYHQHGDYANSDAPNPLYS